MDRWLLGYLSKILVNKFFLLTQIIRVKALLRINKPSVMKPSDIYIYMTLSLVMMVEGELLLTTPGAYESWTQRHIYRYRHDSRATLGSTSLLIIWVSFYEQGEDTASGT